jgi:hypothetical protein
MTASLFSLVIVSFGFTANTAIAQTEMASRYDMSVVNSSCRYDMRTDDSNCSERLRAMLPVLIEDQARLLDLNRRVTRNVADRLRQCASANPEILALCLKAADDVDQRADYKLKDAKSYLDSQWETLSRWRKMSPSMEEKVRQHEEAQLVRTYLSYFDLMDSPSATSLVSSMDIEVRLEALFVFGKSCEERGLQFINTKVARHDLDRGWSLLQDTDVINFLVRGGREPKPVKIECREKGSSRALKSEYDFDTHTLTVEWAQWSPPLWTFEVSHKRIEVANFYDFVRQVVRK